MITVADYKELIIHELKLTSLDEAIWVDTIWEMYNEKSFVGSRLQYLYTKRHLANSLLSRTADDGMDWKAGDYSESSSGIISTYKSVINSANSEIREILNKLRANRPPKIGEITKVAPIEVPTGYIDPNDRLYRGDALKRY